MLGATGRVMTGYVCRAALLAMVGTALFAVVPSPAHAYLDAGAGSVLLQLLVGGAAGLIVALRLWWRSILAMVGIKTGEPASTAEGADADSPGPSQP